jgi:prevent-host-death family protein
MAKINVAEDIIPIAEFKTHASELIRKIHATKRPLVITQNGKPSAVVMTPAEFEDLSYRQFVRAKVQAGIDSAKPGQTIPSGEVRRRLKALVGED